MSWAARRKFIIEAVLVACAVGIIAVVLVATLYKTPSCMDGKQNQGEQGIDCGGPCPYACNVQETAPSVRFSRDVSPQSGRYDLIAYIDNSNSNAELQNAQYTVQFYGPNQNLIAQKTAFITIPPSTTAPVFVPDFYLGNQVISQVFLTFSSSTYQWLRTDQKPLAPTPANIQIDNSKTPKITATLTNPSAQTLTDVTVVATVFDAENNAIAASQTVVPEFAAQSTVPVIFTWNEPFPGTPVRVEILPAALTSL